MVIIFTSITFGMYINMTPEIVLPNLGVDEKVSFGTNIGGNIPFANYGIFDGIWNVDGRILDNMFESFNYSLGVKISLPVETTLDQISQNIVMGQEFNLEETQFFMKPYIQFTKVIDQSWQVNFILQYKYVWFNEPKSYLIYGLGVEQKLF